jgi:divalent metal cation (Fe/Co/Zn/Cd) transporter
MRDPTWNYVVLAAAALFEGASFVIALAQFARRHATTRSGRRCDRSKDPTTYTVLAEDSAALVGLAVAALGIYFSHSLDMPALDGVASVVIGVLLAGVAVLLIREARGLLVGEGIRPETVRAIRSLVMEQPSVENVGHVLSMYIGPDEALVIVDVNFKDDTPTGDAAEAIAAIEKQVRARFPMIKRIFIEASDAPGAL